jgi:Protein of unknown function (DUF4239)
MIDAWLDLPTFALFAVLILFYGITTAIIVWLFSFSALRARILTLTGIVAPFFAATSVLFALLTGFLGNDVGDRNRQAWRAVNAETTAASAVYTLSMASKADMQDIRAALRDYLQSVIKDEWPHLSNGASAKTDGAYARLLQEVSDPNIASAAGAAVHGALLNATLRLAEARSTRISLASDRTNELKWISVLVLGVITQVSLAMVHLEKPRAQLAAILLFSAAAVVALGLIALQEQPFDGAIRISPDAVAATLKAMGS